MNLLSCILFFYLSEVSLLFDDVFLLQAKKIELWKIEKSEQPHLLQQSSETKDATGTHSLFVWDEKCSKETFGLVET